MASDPPSRRQLEAAIAAQDGLRSTLGDGIVDATIAALRAQLAALTDATEVAHQRKLVTVLFMDVVGSTDLIQGRDPEEAMSILDAAMPRLGGAVARHGGRVTKYMGDGFMAVFGLPTARENDPEMAVRAGLAIVRAAEDLAMELDRQHGVSGFTVRVGINTGLVATGGVTEAEDTIVGDAVNLAARLEQAAGPGGVLISRGTRQHVRGLFELEDGGSIEAKGFPDPVPVYRVVGVTAGVTRHEAHGIEGVETPMVGRRTELAGLVAAFERVATGGSLQAVTVLGEAGIGKSRLLEEVRVRLEGRDHVLLEGRAMLAAQQVPYGLIRDLLERRFGIRPDDDATAARVRLVDGIAADLGSADEAEQRSHFIGQLIGYDFSDSPHIRGSLESPQQIRSRAVMYLGQLVAALAATRPVALVLEDLQWADAGSFDVLDGVLEALQGCRVFVVAAGRSSLPEQRPGWGRLDGHEWIRLEPLADPEIEALAAALLGRLPDPPEDLLRRLVRQAGGSPYYLEETIRMLVDDGIVVTGDGAWTIDRTRSADLRIPATLTGVVQARLDGLPQSHRLVLQLASVVGPVFWDATVEELASAGGRAEVRPILAALEQRDMIHARPTSTFPGAVEYAFHNEILHAVAYEAVLLRTRRDHHSVVADWLIARGGDRATELSGVIAGHLERAGRSAEALGYFAEAAGSALAAYAVETADAYYERALGLVPPGDVATRFDLLLGRERTLGMRDRSDEQLALLDELATLATTDESVAIVGVQRAWFHYFAGEYASAAEAARSAIAAAARRTDPAQGSLARRALASALLAAGEVDAAQPEAEQALLLARTAGDARIEMKVQNTLGLVALVRGDLSEAREHLAVYLETARELGALDDELTAANNLGTVETQLGSYPAAKAHFERIRAIAGEVGDRLAEGSALVNLAWVTASDGEWAAAREFARRGVARKRAGGHPDSVAEVLMWLGHAELGLGDDAAAEAAYAEALRLREELGLVVHAVDARAGLAATALARGDAAAALSLARTIVRYLDDGGTLAGAWEPLRIHLTCVEVLRVSGDPDADRVLERAQRTLRELAERIRDDTDRRSFLDRVPWHRRLLELAPVGQAR